MGRWCRACRHPDVEELNRKLIEGRIPTSVIANEYGIGVQAIKRHREHHLKPVIEEIKAKAKETAANDYIEGQVAAQMILKHLPEVLRENRPSLKEIIDVIKIVSGGSSSGEGDKTVVITWGIGAGDRGKIQISDSVYQPEGITDADIKELEQDTAERKTEKPRTLGETG